LSVLQNVPRDYHVCGAPTLAYPPSDVSGACLLDSLDASMLVRDEEILAREHIAATTTPMQ
jgi:hypothetical protein